VCPIKHITKAVSYIYQIPESPSHTVEPTKCIWLPQHAEAQILLEKYLSDITYVHHVIHLPSMQALMDDLYQSISQQVNVKPGTVALFLSIFASATYAWTLRTTDTLFTTVDEANSQSMCWTKAAMDVLEQSRRTTSGTLEDIQAMIILSFVVCNMEGQSPRYRTLISTAISVARDLSLHRIDHHSNSTLPSIPLPDSVQAEMGRRVWWYLAATDW